MLMCCYVKNDAGDDFYWIFFLSNPRGYLPISFTNSNGTDSVEHDHS
jgi:hypothetical protein